MTVGGSAIESNQNPSTGSGPVVLGTVSTLNVSFSPLQTSHAGQYQCTATINIPGVPLVFTDMITSLYVQGKKKIHLSMPYLFYYYFSA